MSRSRKVAIRVGHYKLGKTLGVGSFGSVRLAEHELTKHKVAIKVLNRRKMKSLDMSEKVWREIRVLKLFRHPHIIRLYEVIETPADIYVVMEYVSGGEMFDFIVSHGRTSEAEARRFFQQIISGVHYSHKHNVVHRDLKPENLLLDKDLNVRIADFGLSNIVQDGRFLQTSCGSPNYAAPEVISGKLYEGPEVDVWSCGVILYALLCGSLPFDDDHIPTLFSKIRGGVYTLPSHLSQGARDMITSMLCVDPLGRISLHDILEHEWFHEDIPRYIMMGLLDEGDTVDAEVDASIVEELVKLGFARDNVLEALAAGARNEVTVAYNLISDERRSYDTRTDADMLEDGDNGVSDEVSAATAVAAAAVAARHSTSPIAMPTRPIPIGGHSAAAAAGSRGGHTPVSPTSLGSSFGANFLRIGSPTPSPRQPVDQEIIDLFLIESDRRDSGSAPMRRRRARPRPATKGGDAFHWVLGLVSSRPAHLIWADTFHILKRQGFMWKITGNYTLKARLQEPRTSAERAIALQLQLFCVREGHHCLDFQRVDGETIPFLQVAMPLIAHLRQH